MSGGFSPVTLCYSYFEEVAQITDNINRASKTDTWSLDELRSAIEVEMDHFRASEEKDNGNDSTSYLKCESISTISVLTNNKSRYSSDKPVRACLFCNGDHLFSFCNKYPSTKTRLPFLFILEFIFVMTFNFSSNIRIHIIYPVFTLFMLT